MRCTTLNIFGFPACGRCPKEDRKLCSQCQPTAEGQKELRADWEEVCRATIEKPNVHAQALKK